MHYESFRKMNEGVLIDND